MSEYIYASNGETLANDKGEIFLARKEITRCRDCKWCMAYWQATYCDYMAHSVEPDGFCAWGERRDA